MANGGAQKPDKNNKTSDSKISISTVVLVLGILLVLFGLWQLTERLMGTWFSAIWQIISLVIGIVWPIVIIGGGVVLMLVARRGKLNMPANRKLFRSTRNKKIGGVCGGIGEYLGVDPVVVRVITIVLAIPLWYVIIPLYILFWIVIGPNKTNYNNWV